MKDEKAQSFPPSLALYFMATLAVLVYGISKENLLIICLACVMAAALQGPRVAKLLLKAINILCRGK
ncbi:hypothetical protein EPA93_44605 [Ktedonosporobacter rubrisoli]|uniref:Uncharacterized protein n=1 Tax=Ktedonosporobacter rubrisoli TaxID=2509675 RepID=A0A4P6K357_KTERU|nr:hypothetical protein [Ktedonosporobacter rubrisoli]QBD82677.1 hypothetical protein EPA93_44605 [Ktedonosporobacter rubrisoli]